MKNKLIIALPMIQSVLDEAAKHFDIITRSEPMDINDIIEISNEENPIGLMVFMKHKFDKDVIQKLPSSIKIIATASVGYDHIDLDAMREKGIIVSNTLDVLSDATADLAFLLMLSVARKLPHMTDVMRNGWGRVLGFGESLGIDLKGKTLGIYGMGRIGKSLAKKALAFDMKIAYCNRNDITKNLDFKATYYHSLEELASNCDVLSLNAPATPETVGVMNLKIFNKMKKNSIFINVARGALVNEDDLIETLKNKKIFGAGLDVYLNEPNFDKRFLEFDNVVLFPHVGSATIETRHAMGMRALENIISSFKNQEVRDRLN